MTETALDRRTSCPQCHKVYKRTEHLQRHLLTHATERPYICSQCGRSFQRTDVLKRHSRTCTGHNFKQYRQTRKACRPCAIAKRACDLQQPCSTCERRGIGCVYASTRDGGDFTGAVASLPDEAPTTDCNDFEVFQFDMPDYSVLLQHADFLMHGIDHASSGQSMPIHPGSGQDASLRLTFLERFTRAAGLVSSFDCGSETQRRMTEMYFEQAIKSQTTPLTEHKLHEKCREIVSLIEEVVKVRPRNSSVEDRSWTSTLEEACVRFFTPASLSIYLELFWAFWHPNVNFLHRQTFDVTTTKASLLGAMVMIGASVSTSANDRANARRWYNCVEEVVFQDDDFCASDEDQTFPSRDRLQALQAAYIVCLYQNWEGTDSSKRRVRRFRYNTLIAVARDVGIRHAKHSPYHLVSIDAFSWAEFVAREQLIRTLLWIFLLDTAFVIFHNSPPRMAIKEMTMHFACSEGCFQAATRADCYRFLSTDTETRHLVFSTTAASLCRGPLGKQQETDFADLGPLNLFALTSALHSMVFQIQQAFGYDIQMLPIRNALDNWIRIWQIYSAQHVMSIKHLPLQHEPGPDDMWKRVGFARFANEYWLLASLIVDRITAAALGDTPSSPALQYGRAHDEDNVLAKYDETSMKQVNDLISEFQKVLI